MNKLNPNIKINRQSAVSQKITNKSGKLDNNIKESKNKNDKVTLSSTSKVKASNQGQTKIASDVRYDIINKYRKVLSSGNYVVKADELADKIVQKIRENKNRIVI